MIGISCAPVPCYLMPGRRAGPVDVCVRDPGGAVVRIEVDALRALAATGQRGLGTSAAALYMAACGAFPLDGDDWHGFKGAVRRVAGVDLVAMCGDPPA